LPGLGPALAVFRLPRATRRSQGSPPQHMFGPEVGRHDVRVMGPL
jgi:hypothetical protein